MFTGLVADLGDVVAVRRSGGGARLTIGAAIAERLQGGGSVAVNGVCLTVAAVDGRRFQADAMNETLARTSLGRLEPGSRVNLELPLRAGEPLGGHVVQGHVDGTGEVVDVRPDGFARRMAIAAAPELLRYVVPRGSIAVDGVSLTVAEVDERAFAVSLIPETLQRTNLGGAQRGAIVNLEVDVLAKYVEKLVAR